jgi:hypothetical protein
MHSRQQYNTTLKMFRALLCPSSEARQIAVATSDFRMNAEVDVFPAVVGLLVRLDDKSVNFTIDCCIWLGVLFE